MSEANKDIAVTFYKAVTEGLVEDAFRLYAGGPYLQHNPLIEDGMEGLRKVVTWLTDAHCEIKRVLADGDYVIRQHTMRSTTLGGKDYCNVYCFVFRFNDEGKIAYLTEHWNTWNAFRILFNNFDVEPAHPTGG